MDMPYIGAFLSDDELSINLRDAIQDASQGRLSPLWQLFFRREYEFSQQNGHLTPEHQMLWQVLQLHLARVPQWSNEEAERRSLQQLGSTLLFYADDPGFATYAEIRFDRRHYYIDAILDIYTPEKERPLAAQRLQRRLEAWLYAQDIVPGSLALPDPRTALDPGSYRTLRQAAAGLLAALGAPDVILG